MAHKTASELAALADAAAHCFTSGKQPTLNQAIVSVVKTAGLNREQVQRVVEQTNKLAYLQQHQAKLGESQRIIEFNGGPARAQEVFSQLNSTPTPLHSADYSDYSSPPVKQASQGYAGSDRGDSYFQDLFGNPKGAPSSSELDPLGECRKLAQHVGSLLKQADSRRSSLESDLQYSQYLLVDQVKQARAENISLGEIVQAWSTLSPTPGIIKTAFERITPELRKMPAWGEPYKLAEEFQKLAAPGFQVDPTHPLMEGFKNFASTLIELEATTKVANDLAEQLQDLTDFLKQAGEVKTAFDKLSSQQVNPPSPPPHASSGDQSKQAALNLDAIKDTLAEGAGGAMAGLSGSALQGAKLIRRGVGRGMDAVEGLLDRASPSIREAFERGGERVIGAMMEHPVIPTLGAAALAAAPLAAAYHAGKNEGRKEASSSNPPPPLPHGGQQKQAAGRPGLLSMAARGLGAVGRGVGKATEFVTTPLFDEGSKIPGHLGTAAQGLTLATPVVLGAGAALKGYNHLQAASNTGPGRFVKSFIPGTDAYEEDKLRTQMTWGAPIDPQMMY